MAALYGMSFEVAAQVEAHASRDRETRGRRPLILRVEGVLQSAVVDVAAIGQDDRLAERVGVADGQAVEVAERPDAERALSELVAQPDVLVARADRDGVVAHRPEGEVLGDLPGLGVELVSLRELIGAGDDRRIAADARSRC